MNERNDATDSKPPALSVGVHRLLMHQSVMDRLQSEPDLGGLCYDLPSDHRVRLIAGPIRVGDWTFNVIEISCQH